MQAPLQLRWGALWGEDPCNEWGNTRRGQMGCKGPNDVVTMGAQNNLCELQGSGGQKQKLENGRGSAGPGAGGQAAPGGT